MGQRTIKRVPLDFDWTLGEAWKGYVSPRARPCPAGADCLHGWTRTGQWLNTWVRILLLAATDPLHPWVQDVDTVPPGGDLSELTTALCGRSPSPWGHDCLDRGRAVRALLRAAGLSTSWATCPTCGGTAYHPDDAAQREQWEPEDPPTGRGWQLWETTTEGSPISPVFATPEALAAWCADNATLFADHRATLLKWLQWIREDAVEVASTMSIRIDKRSEQ